MLKLYCVSKGIFPQQLLSKNVLMKEERIVY